MNRQMFSWISDLVTSKPDQITTLQSSRIGLSVLEHYHCGYISKDRLVFSTQDKLILRQRVIDELGIDPFINRQLPENRTEMAKFHSNEKLVSKPVSHDHLLLTCPEGVIHVNGKQVELYPELIPTAGLVCLNSGIESIEHDSIVVVENLAMMQVCGASKLPSLARQAIWIYRGDHKSGSKVNTCHDFLKRFGGNKQVIVFSDMDPKGIEIALTMPFAKFWLGPEKDSWLPFLKSRNASRNGFDNQSVAMDYLLRLLDSNSLSMPLTELITTLRDERSSLRQEFVYSLNVPLEIYPTLNI